MTPGEIIQCPPSGAEITLAGWSLHTGAWCVPDVDDLLSGLDMRGSSVLVEGLDGQVPRDRRPDETEFSLPMVFAGGVDRLGGTYADAYAGLSANRRAFKAQIVTGAVILLRVEHADGTIEEGDAIAPRLLWEQKPNALALATLRLIVPRPLVEVAA